MFAQGGVYAIVPSNGISKSIPKGVNKGTFMALARGNMLVCTDKGSAINCTILGHADKAVESNFGTSNTAPVVENNELVSTVQINKPELAKVLLSRVGDNDLRNICFDIGEEYDDLPGDNRERKVRELISHLGRRGALGKLIVAAFNIRAFDINEMNGIIHDNK